MAKIKEEKENPDIIETLLKSKEFEGLHFGSRSGKEIEPQDIISTSSFWFDYIIGGGFRAGSWGRFLSEPECGKSSMALCWGRNWQDFYKDQGFIVYYNSEGRVNLDLLNRSGINTDKNKFRIIDCNNADVIYTMTEKLITNNPDDRKYFIVIDSTDACQRSIDMGKNLGFESEKIASGATIASAAGKRLSLLFNRCGFHYLFMCSQVRDRLNTMSPGAHGKDASGGNAPRFYSSLIGQIQKPWSDTYIYEKPSDKKSKMIGRMCEIKLLKTYNETTGTVVQIPIKYGLKGGIWRNYEAMMIAQSWNIYNKKGSWFTIEESFAADMKKNNVKFEESFQGEKEMRDNFDSNPELVEYIINRGKDLIL